MKDTGVQFEEGIPDSVCTCPLVPDSRFVIQFIIVTGVARFRDMEDAGVQFHEGIPASDHLKSWFPKSGLLILDDLMAEGASSKYHGVAFAARHVSTKEIC